MHTLIFDSHIAILDPRTGMGLLILPDPPDGECFFDTSRIDQNAQTAVQRWFGQDASEYSKIIRQLSSIGWNLPEDNDGAAAWFDAGRTDCCGRSMISLLSHDVEGPEPTLHTLIENSERSQCLAAQACCGLSHLVGSMNP